MGFCMHAAGISVQRSDTRRGCGIDAVILAAPATGVLPDPRRCGRCHIHHGFIHRDQPQRQVVTESLGVLRGPAAFGSLPLPREQLAIAGETRVDPE